MHPATYPLHIPMAVVYRGGYPENIHHGSLAVVNAQGQLLASVGDVHSSLFTRSSLKPFQAMPLIARAADRLNLDDADVALLCASHSGEPMHVERAASLLARIGASKSSLACGTHVPFFFGATGATPEPGKRFTRLHHN
ncbi:MAG: asparaginase, partial [Hydrogenophaga sp.]